MFAEFVSSGFIRINPKCAEEPVRHFLTKLVISKVEYAAPGKLAELMIVSTWDGQLFHVIPLSVHIYEPSSYKFTVLPVVPVPSHVWNVAEIILSALNDKNVVLSFAHPAFTAQRVENPQTFFKSLIDKSNGLIKGTERHHMSYFLPIKRGSTTQEMVDNTNKMIDEFKLLNIGGHDNHGYKLLS